MAAFVKSTLNRAEALLLNIHDYGVLRSVALRPIPRLEMTAGVFGFLSRQGLVEMVSLPSPFRVHEGRSIAHVAITDAGRKVVAEIVEGGA